MAELQEEVLEAPQARYALGQEAERYTVAKEIANSVTHGVGLALSIAALVMLIVFAVRYSTAVAVVAASVYGATLVLLYTTSTLYHALPKGPAKRVFEVLDHSAIFLLIAGTYTPYTLVKLPAGWGWSLFGVIWGLAVLGIVLEATLRVRGRNVQLALYLVMGWLILIAMGPLVSAMPAAGLALLALGGVCYSLGVVFFLWHSLRFHHVVWHVFVLAGSACHVLSVLFFVVGVHAELSS
ncbi:MAG: hemolysin III family protein [Pseudomonadota bacterium]